MQKLFRSLVLVFAVLALAACGAAPQSAPVDGSAPSEVTDLQLALLNHISYKTALKDLVGKSIEGHEELIDVKYKDNISGGEKLVDELKGYTLVDFDDGHISGFKAAAYAKGSSLVVVYCGTDSLLDIDSLVDLSSALFDLSPQDRKAKDYAKDRAAQYGNHDLYITGYSLGGRLCYLGTEAAVDEGLGDRIKKVRTFNGLGVKEALDFTDSKLSNIHGLETKFADKALNYVVEGDEVSGQSSHYMTRAQIGYCHIGPDIVVPCTNETDSFLMKAHDLYSVIDYLLNNPAPAENSFERESFNSQLVLDIVSGEFLNVSGDVEVGSWTTFVSKYPEAADPLGAGREYFAKMHPAIFTLEDADGNTFENRGLFNPSGFGIDPFGWADTYGELEWDDGIPFSADRFVIYYEGSYFSGPAEGYEYRARPASRDTGMHEVEAQGAAQSADPNADSTIVCKGFSFVIPEYWRGKVEVDQATLDEGGSLLITVPGNETYLMSASLFMPADEVSQYDRDRFAVEGEALENGGVYLHGGDFSLVQGPTGDVFMVFISDIRYPNSSFDEGQFHDLLSFGTGETDHELWKKRIAAQLRFDGADAAPEAAPSAEPAAEPSAEAVPAQAADEGLIACDGFSFAMPDSWKGKVVQILPDGSDSSAMRLELPDGRLALAIYPSEVDTSMSAMPPETVELANGGVFTMVTMMNDSMPLAYVTSLSGATYRLEPNGQFWNEEAYYGRDVSAYYDLYTFGESDEAGYDAWGGARATELGMAEQLRF